MTTTRITARPNGGSVSRWRCSKDVPQLVVRRVRGAAPVHLSPRSSLQRWELVLQP